MPLTDDPEILDVTCACSYVFPNYAAFYAHVGDCPLLRCSHCLTWLIEPYEPAATHICPPAKYSSK